VVPIEIKRAYLSCLYILPLLLLPPPSFHLVQKIQTSGYLGADSMVSARVQAFDGYFWKDIKRRVVKTWLLLYLSGTTSANVTMSKW
jgi:hypothetical protein